MGLHLGAVGFPVATTVPRFAVHRMRTKRFRVKMGEKECEWVREEERERATIFTSKRNDQGKLEACFLHSHGFWRFLLIPIRNINIYIIKLEKKARKNNLIVSFR